MWNKIKARVTTSESRPQQSAAWQKM